MSALSFRFCALPDPTGSVPVHSKYDFVFELFLQFNVRLINSINVLHYLYSYSVNISYASECPEAIL